MERKDKGYASIDDIYANPFMKMLIQVAANIVLTKKSINSSYANSYYVSQLINKDRKKMTRKMEQIYQSCLNLIYIFFNSLFEDLSNVFTLDVKKNYSKTIASVFKNL